MNEDKARLLVHSLIRIAKNIGDIYRSTDDFEYTKKDDLSSIIYDIHEDVIHKILDEYPTLRLETELMMSSPKG